MATQSYGLFQTLQPMLSRIGGNNECKQYATSGAVLNSFSSAISIRSEAVGTVDVEPHLRVLTMAAFILLMSSQVKNPPIAGNTY